MDWKEKESGSDALTKINVSDPDPSIIKHNSKKILISTVLYLLYDFLSFVGVWKVTDEKSRIRIRTKMSLDSEHRQKH